MRRIICAAMLALTMAGCSTLQSVQTAVQLGTVSIANPVTKDRLNQVESTLTIVFAGLKAWKSSCQQGLINADCKSQIAAVQVYTRQIPPYLRQLRGFAKVNDQVNAILVFKEITSLIGTVKSQAAAGGVNLGS